MTEARQRTIIIYEIQETGVLKKYWLRKKRNILNLPSKKRKTRGIVFGVPHDEACNYAVFQSSAKFNKSISVITRNKTEQKKFAKNQIREKGIRYDQKKKDVRSMKEKGQIANF